MYFGVFALFSAKGHVHEEAAVTAEGAGDAEEGDWLLLASFTWSTLTSICRFSCFVDTACCSSSSRFPSSSTFEL